MNREALTKLQATIVVAVITFATVTGVSVWWVTSRKPVPSPPRPPTGVELGSLTRIKTVIKVEAEGIILHYQNESFWTEDSFSRILGV